MSGRFFLDTNVLVYALSGEDSRKATIGGEIIEQALATRRGVISYQVVQEFFSVAFRRFPQKPTSDEAHSYLTTVLRPMLAVQSSVGLCAEALQMRERYQLSWYDSLIVAAAQEARCSVLYTEDLQNGQRFGDVVVEDPFR